MKNKTDYVCEIVNSSRDFTKREAIAIKDLQEAISIDKFTEENGSFTLDAVDYAELQIHNEHTKRDNPDYTQYVIVDKDGTKYVTGSMSFWSAFVDVFDDLIGDEGVVSFKVFRKPSTNFAGKSFITCTLL